MNLAFVPRRDTAIPVPPALLARSLDEGAAYTRLVNSISIERKLEEIRRKRLPLRLLLSKNGDIHEFHASIQATSPGSSHVVLTQLSPCNWRHQIDEELPVTVSCQMPNGHLLFDSRISPVDNGLYCTLEIPTEMHKQQTRSSSRVALQQHEVQLCLGIGNRKFLGSCQDLSLGGCRGLFSEELLQYLMTHDDGVALLARSRFTLHLGFNEVTKIETQVRICRSKPEQGGKLTLGMRFVDTDCETERKLQRTLSAFQREQLRPASTAALRSLF